MGSGFPGSPGAAGPLGAGSAFGSRYHIIRLLGVGGMGAVYQAWDDALGVAVALKVIRPEITADPAAARDLERRFKRELLLARQVTHKNVVRIHDLGEIDGIKYITMPYIQGSDLASILARERKLPVARAIGIARQVASGLQAAHDAGVVHRDLKPANVMIDADEQAVIMDFGIARSVSGGATVAGAVVGTLEYMAPEQAMAQPVDHRADIYALGLMLYDMVLGPRYSSRAESAVAELMARVQKPLPPARSIDPTIPEALERVIDRCTQPDPGARYQATEQLVQDLAVVDPAGRGSSGTGALLAPPVTRPQEPIAKPAVRAVPLKAVIAAAVVLAVAVSAWLLRDRFGSPSDNGAGVKPITLAVLPFHNTTGDSQLNWLGETILEMLQGEIGQSARVRSISSNRIEQILGDLRITVGPRLDTVSLQRLTEFSTADTVVSGQYAKSGNEIRIEATVHDKLRESPTVLRAAASEAELRKAIRELAGSIQGSLALPAEALKELRATASGPSSDSIQALRYFNEGVQLVRQGNHLEAKKRFDAATKEDPKFALAYARLAQTQSLLGYADEAEKIARQAVDLSERLPARERHLVLAAHAGVINDHERAIQEYKALVDAAPEDMEAHFELAGRYEAAGLFDAAREHYMKVVSRDPNYADALYALGRVEIRRENPEGSLEYLNRALSLAIQVDNAEARATYLHALAVAYRDLKRYEDALRNHQEALALRQRVGDKRGMRFTLMEMGHLYQDLGDPDSARKSYEQALDIAEEIGERTGVAQVLNSLGVLHERAGRYDQAVDFYKRALVIQVELRNERAQILYLQNIGHVYFTKTEYADAASYFERGLQLAEQLKLSTDIAQLLHNLALIATRTGRHDQALAHSLRALDVARAASDRESMAMVLLGTALLHLQQGRYNAAVGASNDGLELLRQLQQRGPWMADMLGVHGSALAMVGRDREANEMMENALKLARELKDDHLLARVHNARGDALFYWGHFTAARVAFDEALKIASRMPDRYLLLLSRLNRAKALLKEGNSAAAILALREVREQIDSLGLRYLSAECAVHTGEALLAAKDLPQAKRELERAVRDTERLDARALQVTSLHLLGSALRRGGDASGADARIAEAAKLLQLIREEAQSERILERADLALPGATAAPAGSSR